MNLSPEDCLVFEDGDLGILAAQEAGMRTIDVREIEC
jgi:HAD superfamily hydrolase (TIGR01509 family)